MFKKTYVAPFQPSAAPSSGDILYWKKLSSPILLKEVSSIDYIDISPAEPHFIGVTCSSRVQLYHPITRMIHKNLNRFKQAAFGAIFRKDGRLLLAGSDENAMKLFDVSSKNLLRVFKGHERAVHRCAFMPTDNHIVSYSDDKTLIQWDLTTEEMLHKYIGHTDYVRCGTTVDANPNTIVSGSYDHTVKVWDKREKTEALSVDHGAPVESVLVSPSGSLLFTAGATEIRVWDCLAGGRLLSKISQHHKTITCLRFGTNSKRLISASLDRHVKIYDMTNFEVIQTLTYASPILSLGISPNDNVLAVGMSDGILAISKREETPEEDREEREALVQTRRKKAKTFSDFAVTDYGIKEKSTEAEPVYDAYLRKFRYSRALDTVLSDNYLYKDPAATVALFQELIRRDGLKKALAGRTGKSVNKVLRFLIRHLRRPRFMRVLLHVSHVFIDLLAEKAGEDQRVDQLLLQLCDEVNKEILYMTELMEVQGSLEMIISNSTEFSTGPAIMSRSTVPAVKLPPSQRASEAVVVSV
ncbi:unnamed protein product [Allacma fusca]|uniref:U3 small nucleolar RNA-associated protein 15 homolog n=1 Tax=Allacma fusca TaxID=39272 RepID=A0A8J2K0A0_9HEXA|nr:unnamed protein product [Allacma fusca]